MSTRESSNPSSNASTRCGDTKKSGPSYSGSTKKCATSTLEPYTEGKPNMSNDYVPNRINNGMPEFGPMGPTSVRPDAPVEKTPIEQVKVTPQQNINWAV